MTTVFEVSAQFGGKDAADAVLPHFWALKSALKGRSFEGLGFPTLALILRVDGEITTFGPSTGKHIRLDRKGEYVSVDLGVSRADWAGRTGPEVAGVIAGLLTSSVALLRGHGAARLHGVDWDALAATLAEAAVAYRTRFSSQGGLGDL